MKVDWIVGWISETELKKKGGNINRYRDNNELIYCLRSIHKYAPWINKIHIILGGNSEIPVWLDAQHDKINIVKEPSLYNPVQPNSETKKMFYHLIPGLADYFFTSDDDMFLVNPIYLPWYFHNNKIIMNSVGYCIEHDREQNDGVGHIPVLWNKKLYEIALQKINISKYVTMGRRRCNPWIIMKKYLVNKKLVIKGNIKNPLLWINNENINKLSLTYKNFLFNMLFKPHSSNNFLCINDDFSVDKQHSYKEQYIMTQRFLTFLFVERTPWEIDFITKYEIGNVLNRIKMNISPCYNTSSKILRVYFKISNDIQFNIVPCYDKINNFLNYRFIDNKIVISRKDGRKGWNFSHDIFIVFIKKDTLTTSNKIQHLEKS